MNHDDKNIERLKQVIEQVAGRRMQTPKDFDFLSEYIFEQLHQHISGTTLKRLWGYLPEPVTPRLSTLNILAQFVGAADWTTFCQQEAQNETTPSPTHSDSALDAAAEPGSEHAHAPSASTPGEGWRRSLRWLVALLILVLSASLLWLYSRNAAEEPADSYVLRKGQLFDNYHDYLKLFGITDTTTYWGKVVPHHPNIVLWGPEYRNPYWHNEGDSTQMMPTITEWWQPKDADISVVAMRNTDKYNHEMRLNEIRITFMKNLKGSGYIFLGVYRLSTARSDSARCVWERVADSCQLGHLDDLEQFRN